MQRKISTTGRASSWEATLGNLEERHSYHTSDDGVGLAEIDAGVEHLDLAARDPAGEGAVRGNAGSHASGRRGLDHSVRGQGLPDLPETDAAQVAGHEHEAHHAGEDHQQGLEGVDVEQALDAAHHSVEGRDDAEDYDAPDHELELYAAEGDDADGYGGDEEAAAAGQQLAD